jgi:retron-type reverse transcriptase
MYSAIYDRENLYQASRNALAGKKSTRSAAKFWLHEDREIRKMHEELKNKSYRFGGYTSFLLNDNGVERRISVAPFRDRVLHHAIMQQIEPLYERSFIYDSYANRKGKGTLNALKRARYYVNKYPYVLQLDIQKFFPSIDHAILLDILTTKITCPHTQALLKALIDNSNRQDDAYFYFEGDDLLTPYQRPKGIPLGNLTSQFFGNLYLDRYDHFVKEMLCVKGYIRYVDDTLYFSESKTFLESIIVKIEKFLAHLRLKIHPLKIKLLQCAEGFVFLGHKIFPTHFRLTSKAIRRGRRKLKKVRQDYRYNNIALPEAKNRIFGTIGFFKMGSNAKLVDELLAQTLLQRKVSAEVVSSRRVVE